MEAVTKHFVFRKGFICDKNRFYFITAYEEALAEGIPGSQVYILIDRQDWYSHAVTWDAVGVTAISHPERTGIVVGRDGDALIGTASGFAEETVDDNGAGPANRGPLRSVRSVGEHVFTVGMDYQVYRRTGRNKWERYENGLPGPPPMPKVVGFNAIDGSDPNDLHAVGWGGEIWYYDGTRWNEASSPTNVALMDVIAVSKKQLYVCGQEGVILKGYRDKWDVVDYEGAEELEFRSLAWFRKKLYLADGHALYVLEDDGLSEVDFGVEAIVPSSHLHVNAGRILSVAGKEVFISTNGTDWDEVPC